MRLVPLLIAALLLMIQYPLWLGHGGWMYVRDMEQQLASQNRTNAQLAARNERLAAEVRDLKEGAGAVEERARYELGMVKDGEVFVQIVEAPTSAGDPAGAPAGEAARPPAAEVARPPAGEPARTPAGKPATPSAGERAKAPAAGAARPAAVSDGGR